MAIIRKDGYDGIQREAEFIYDDFIRMARVYQPHTFNQPYIWDAVYVEWGGSDTNDLDLVRAMAEALPMASKLAMEWANDTGKLAQAAEILSGSQKPEGGQ